MQILEINTRRVLLSLAFICLGAIPAFLWGTGLHEPAVPTAIETSVTDKEIVHMESLFALPGEDIDATENFIFQETGKHVQVESCRFYQCYYPLGWVSECSTDIGKFFIAHIGGDLTLSSGFPRGTCSFIGSPSGRVLMAITDAFQGQGWRG